MNKQLLTILSSAAVLFAACSGGEEEPPVAVTLEVAPASITLENEAQSTATFAITCNADWAITVPTTADWFELSTIIGTGNATVTVTVISANPDAETRSARLNIAAGDQTASVVLSQGVVPTAPAQAAISGDHANECPTKTITLTATATGADSYLWYKGGVEIAEATNASYEVTESGEYTVIGVNEVGLGTLSAPHAVTITECIPDAVEGAWVGSGWAFLDEKAHVYDENIEAVSTTKFIMKNLFRHYDPTYTPYIIKDVDGNYWYEPSEERIGTVAVSGQSFDVYQVPAGYETRNIDDGAYILDEPLSLTWSADSTTLSLPETIFIEIQGGGTVEVTPAFASIAIVQGQEGWIECIGEMTFTREDTESSQIFGKAAKTPSSKAPVYKGRKVSKLKP